MDPLILDQTEIYKQFKDNPLFRSFARGIVETLINQKPAASP